MVDREGEGEPLRIYVSVRGDGSTADAYYRARAPWSVCRHFAGDRFEIAIGPMTDNIIGHIDILWAQRPNSMAEELIVKDAKAARIPVIVDVDDDLFDIPPSAGDIFDHYHYRGKAMMTEQGTLNVKAPLAHHQRCLNAADVITVPTDRLANVIAPYLPGEHEYRTLPNYVLWGDWDWMSDKVVNSWYDDDEISAVGWFGHFYHAHDLQWVIPALARAMGEKRAHVIMMGQPEIEKLFPMRWKKNLHIENIISFPHFSQIRQLIKTFDVGICPLMDIPFNRGKSWLKALQFGAAGVVPVCSAAVYDQVPELVELGLVAQDIDEFGDILIALLSDKAKREEKARKWHEVVKARYTYEALAYGIDGRPVPNAMRWLELAEEVANAKK